MILRFDKRSHLINLLGLSALDLLSSENSDFSTKILHPFFMGNIYAFFVAGFSCFAEVLWGEDLESH